MLRVKHCISINLNQLQSISIVDIWLLNSCEIRTKISVCIKLHCIKVRENKSAYYKTYAFNKYNKAWLNTNLAKTPTLFTVTSSRNCLKYSEKRIASIQRIFFTFTCLNSHSSLAKTWLSVRNRISPGL